MRKTMVRIFAAVLVLAMAIGFLAMIPASATGNVVVAYHNVFFDEYLQIMYAIYVPAGMEIDRIDLSDNAGNTCSAVPYSDNNPIPTYNGVECKLYVAAEGVTLQNIDAVVTAKVYVKGQTEPAAIDDYSILEYLHKRLIVDDLTGMSNEEAMYNSLLATAEAMQVVLNTDGIVTLHNNSYVRVENGTVDGTYSDSMLPVGSKLEKVSTELSASETQEIEWTVTEYSDTGVVGETYKTTAIEEVVVEAGVNLVLSAALKDKEVTEVDYSGRYYIATVRSSGNYFYMTSDLGSASTKRYTAVDSGLSELPEKITGILDGYVFVLEANEDGTYYIYAEGSDSANYLGWTSDNSGILVDKESAKALTVDKTEEGLYNIHFTGDVERYLALNNNSGNNYFAWYKSGQKQNLTLIPIEECEHTYDAGVVTAPKCTEVGYTTYTCSKCGFITKDDEVAATGHLNIETTAAIEATCKEKGYTEGTYCNDCNTYVAGHEEISTVDCVYEGGVCKWCGEAESSQGGEPAEPQEATLDLSNSANRTAFSTTQQVWSANGVTLTNNKGSSSSNIANYTPPRLYAKSQTIIECAGGKITQIVFTCNGSSYATAMVNSCNAVAGATATASGSVVTVTFAEPVDSFTITMSAQVRMGDSVVVTYIPE